MNEEKLNRLEPIEGSPGWYFDPITGERISESDFGDNNEQSDPGDLLDRVRGNEEPEETAGDDSMEPEGPEEDLEISEEDQQDSSSEEENPEPQQEGEESPGGPETSDGEGSAEGKAGESTEGLTEEASEASELAESAEAAEAAAAATEVAEAAEAAEAVVAIAAAPEEGAVALGLLAVVTAVVIIILISMAFVGYGDKDSAYADECTPTTTIVIDPGHISENINSKTQEEYDRDKANGTGSMGTSGNGVVEREVNQQVSNLLTQELKSRGYNAILTKNNADDFMSNRARGQLARDNQAQLIIKIHNDGDGPLDENDNPIPGMIFYHSNASVIASKENDQNELGEYISRRDDSTIAEDLSVAEKFNTAFAAAVSTLDMKYSNGSAYPTSYRPHPSNAGFGYTYDIPTSLVEMSSLRQINDANFIKDPANQQKVAKAIADGVASYMSSDGGGCAEGIGSLETPPGITGPNAQGYYLFPPSSENLYGLYGASDNSCNHWGSMALNQVVYTVAKKFAEKYPANKMQIGDLNSSGHATHDDGRDVDIDIPSGMMVDGAGYNRALAEYAAKLYFQTNTIKWIYYDDQGLADEINAWARQNNLSGEMKPIGGHHNHFHVRLNDEHAGSYHKPSCP